MGRLRDLLKGAMGEATINSRLGQWRLALSDAVSAVEETIRSGVFDSLTVLGNLNFWTSQNGGWRDIVGQLNDFGGPSFDKIAGTNFRAFNFGINAETWIVYHIQHDYALRSPIFMHAHWLADGVDPNPVKWEFEYTYAKGFDQANYDFTGTIVTVEQSSPSAFRHMTSEIVLPITDPNFEPDGLILLHLTRVTNGAVDNLDNIFLLTADCHFQANTFATKFRHPNFYSGSGP